MTESPKRVLVVDNDPDVLDSVAFNLKIADYEVLTANSLQEAQEILAREIVHLAIIDLRLQYEDRVEDISGFEVARIVPDYIPCVIFTAYEDKESIRKALGEVGARAILDKKSPDAASQLIQIVDDLFASEVKVNFDLEIEGSLDLSGLANQMEILVPDKESPPSAADVQQVFGTLFQNAVSIYLAYLLSPESVPTPSQVSSVLVMARPRFENAWGAPVVIKFSDQDKIKREANNYRLLKPFLGGQRLAVLEGEAYSRQLGGLVYSLLGAGDWETIRPFSELFLAEDTARLIGLLERFFSQTFQSLFAGARREKINLTTIYAKGLGLTPKKLRTALQEFRPDALTEPRLCFNGLPDSFRNPVMWAVSDEQFRSFEVFSRQCLCHGDLHSRNMLVDADGHFWLIDFARVAESHALRDFVELETDIKFNLLPVVDLKALLPFEQALLAPVSFEETPGDVSFTSAQLDHTYQIVLALRRIAAQLINLTGDIREYYQALLLHTLNIMRLQHISSAKKEYALLSAALICEWLDE